MAEVIWQNLGQGKWNAASAGSKPAGYVHPLALKAIAEIGLATEGLTSKPVEPFLERQMDLAVTVCDNAKQACPILPGVKQMLHWPFEDPADATGTDDEKMESFRLVRDQIQAKIAEFLKAQSSDDQNA